MSNTVKRVLATVLILFGTFLLIMMIDGFYMKTAITALFVTIATFILRRRKKLEEKRRLHERLEKELDEEEKLEKEKLEKQDDSDSNVEEVDTNLEKDEDEDPQEKENEV